ncbi:MAG: hypothetical protein FGM37_05375, partial [Phycisphaerales bacterium]|nr:hypothetical protein [Phycisphaerales bacterium]
MTTNSARRRPGAAVDFRLALGAAPLLLPLALPSAALAGSQLVVEFVANFPPAVCQRVNAAGQIAGDFQFNAVTRAMRYDPGAVRIPLDVPTGTTQSIGTSINASGVV